ncbi:Di-copper centre-containing protein [Microthyrium microscopicum]|uniref:Di-copper centre-containing protein n=1 Tax=Microthyrium microscopicum TaxID=703497 RepID=A0A6A6UAE3_9PEZI|nr:Di-copper centre-containing protein [Microthyrium microscopicum]
MRYLSVIAVVAACGLSVESRPENRVQGPSESCTNPRIRKEWRSLSIQERKDYIRATKCMQSAPSKFNKQFPVAQNRYDDFVALHVSVAVAGPTTPSVGPAFGGHEEGNILPWHRYMIQLWEDALISECGWKGGVPYWNWFLDTPSGGGSFTKSPIFDPDSGFGGNGKKINSTFSLPGATGGGCVDSGPFQQVVLHIGPSGLMKLNNNRCLTRNFIPWIVESDAAKSTLVKALDSKTFGDFMEQVQRTGHAHGGIPTMETIFSDLHSIGHYSINGEMGDPLTSINEPLFWLHHGGIDQFWSVWQDKDPKRLYDLDASPKRNLGAKAGDGLLDMGIFAPNKTVHQVADPLNRDGSGILCFRYEGLPIERYLEKPKVQSP